MGRRVEGPRESIRTLLQAALSLPYVHFDMAALKCFTVNPDDAAELYLRYYHKKDAEDSWILEKADVLFNSNIDEVWEITRAVIEKAPSNEALAYVAAGPLEDLLRTYGHMVIERVEQEAAKSERFVLALSGCGAWNLEHQFSNAGMRLCGSMDLPKAGERLFEKELTTQAKDITDTLPKWIYPGFLPASLISSRLCSMNT